MVLGTGDGVTLPVTVAMIWVGGTAVAVMLAHAARLMLARMNAIRL